MKDIPREHDSGCSFILIFAAILLFFFSAVLSNDLTAVWDANSEPDLDGYRIFYGYGSGNYKFYNDVHDTSFAIIWNDSTAIYCAVKAYDTSGNVSDYSHEAVYEPAANVFDFNDDGRVDALDTLWFNAQITTPGFEYKKNMDVDKDGAVNALDKLRYFDYLQGLNK